jgi:inhibitor of KinA
VRLSSLGDSALVVRIAPDEAAGDAATIEALRAAVAGLATANLPGVVDVAAASATVTLVFDPTMTSVGTLGPLVEHLLRARSERPAPAPRAVSLPVCYGGAHGPDLDAVAEHTGLDPNTVIRLHTNARYRVAMIGFLPGFPYLVGLPAALAMPRLAEPRMQVPAGAVGIAGDRTGVYPLASPGGWRIIGRTPLPLFHPDRDPPTLLAAGDIVRFTPIDAAAFDRLATEAGR